MWMGTKSEAQRASKRAKVVHSKENGVTGEHMCPKGVYRGSDGRTIWS